MLEADLALLSPSQHCGNCDNSIVARSALDISGIHSDHVWSTGNMLSLSRMLQHGSSIVSKCRSMLARHCYRSDGRYISHSSHSSHKYHQTH
ncbi:hypothetical protein HBI25_112190 [Parastagonospora nodorum]|nr:hypothetical protein HBH54_064160 [Parastagonospora nodorum]KAH4001861.1 hypothetical protein HBI10_081120 [Parastagonospora nodorum]KAH4039749.1 hypothetical protein HBI09_036190 [Parastagonospora nodorum]KAH4075760.1 hypothetical protein HBH50_021160 [Parastagonospora nodorum]KAH4108488.1 hypothetical protein HBH46_044160 [Parastagonospora nodorum]